MLCFGQAAALSGMPICHNLILRCQVHQKQPPQDFFDLGFMLYSLKTAASPTELPAEDLTDLTLKKCVPLLVIPFASCIQGA